MRSVILDADSLGGDISLKPIELAAESLTVFGKTLPAQVDERIAGADIVIVNKVKLNKEHFARHPQLKLVSVTATGTNNIALQAAEQHGVAVRNVVHYGTPTIVQHVFSLVLALSNHLLDYHRDVVNGAWQKSSTFCLMDYPIRELAGLKLGIFGYGALGKAVAEVGRAFGMQVIVGARPGSKAGHRHGTDYLPFRQVLSEADVISLHCLLSEQTQHMIDASTLKLMKKDALLINTARGGLVDEQALADALQQYRLGGAGFDVLSEEPPVHGNALLNPRIPNLLVTPHCAWASLQARQRLIEMTAENVRCFIVQQQQQ